MGLLQQTAQPTIPGQQFVQGAQATLNAGNTLGPDVIKAASEGVVNANAAIQGTMTPGSRQQYMDQTNAGPAQTNFDDLASKLASYDNAVLKPQFAGSDPGTPPEMSRLSGFVQPGLTYAGTGDQTPDQSIYNANPAFALSAQNTQRNSIVDLLGTLNTVLKNESARGTNKYSSDLKSIAAALDPLQRILEKNADVQLRREEMASAAADRAAAKGESADREFYSAVASGVNELQSGEDWGTVWSRIKSRFPHRSDSEIDQQLGTAWRNPGAFEAYKGKIEGTKSSQSTPERQRLAGNVKSAIADLDKVAKLSQDTKQLALAELPGGLGARDFVAARNNVMDVIARIRTGAVMNKQEEATYRNFMPRIGDTPQDIQNKMNRLRNYFNSFLSGGAVEGTDPTSFDTSGSAGGSLTQPDGTSWKQNGDGSYTRIK